jgi:hypothetical protein
LTSQFPLLQEAKPDGSVLESPLTWHPITMEDIGRGVPPYTYNTRARHRGGEESLHESRLGEAKMSALYGLEKSAFMFLQVATAAMGSCFESLLVCERWKEVQFKYSLARHSQGSLDKDATAATSSSSGESDRGLCETLLGSMVCSPCDMQSRLLKRLSGLQCPALVYHVLDLDEVDNQVLAYLFLPPALTTSWTGGKTQVAARLMCKNISFHKHRRIHNVGRWVSDCRTALNMSGEYWPRQTLLLCFDYDRHCYYVLITTDIVIMFLLLCFDYDRHCYYVLITPRLLSGLVWEVAERENDKFVSPGDVLFLIIREGMRLVVLLAVIGFAVAQDGVRLLTGVLQSAVRGRVFPRESFVSVLAEWMYLRLLSPLWAKDTRNCSGSDSFSLPEERIRDGRRHIRWPVRMNPFSASEELPFAHIDDEDIFAGAIDIDKEETLIFGGRARATGQRRGSQRMATPPLLAPIREAEVWVSGLSMVC